MRPTKHTRRHNLIVVVAAIILTLQNTMLRNLSSGMGGSTTQPTQAKVPQPQAQEQTQEIPTLGQQLHGQPSTEKQSPNGFPAGVSSPTPSRRGIMQESHAQDAKPIGFIKKWGTDYAVSATNSSRSTSSAGDYGITQSYQAGSTPNLQQPSWHSATPHRRWPPRQQQSCYQLPWSTAYRPIAQLQPTTNEQQKEP